MKENITYEYCLRCHRKLRTEDAKKLGYGKICYEKAHSENTKSKLFIPVVRRDNT